MKPSAHRWKCERARQFALRRRAQRALIARMKINTHRGAPDALYMDQGGRIECLEHAPYVGSDTWIWNDWRPITRREAQAFERDVGRAPTCDTCAAIARRAAEQQ
jgi:hypothetical protein